MSPALVSIAVRSALYLDLMALFGLAAFGLHALRGAERRSAALIGFRSLLGAFGVAGLLLSGLSLVTLAAGMSGVPLLAVDRASIDTVLWETSVGSAWLVRMAALLAAMLFAILGRRAPAVSLAAIAGAGGVALATLAWTGHGAMDEGATGWVHLIADIVHLLAAGIWIGALLALLILLFQPSRRVDRDHLLLLHRTLAGFSATGTLVVALLVATGLMNVWQLVGLRGLAGLPTSPYGQLLILKLLLFAAMLALAAGNRFRLVPALAAAVERQGEGSALRALRFSLVSEAACGVLILGLVGWLGTLHPPVSSL